MLGMGIKQVALSIMDKNGARCAGTAVEANGANGADAAPAVTPEPARKPVARKSREVPPRLRR
jgi:rare lipoprotein A